MKAFASLFLLASTVTASRVVGAAEGFAKGVTGGGDAAEVFPKSNTELVNYLKDDTPRVIVLDHTFDFTGTEGRTKATGCAPFGTGRGCQTAINKNDWCTNYQKTAPKVPVDYDNAGLNPINVGSSKTIVGVDDKGIIKGKGLYIANGANNIIIQNIMITELNPQYVWGGDAIAIDGADYVWIDHVTTYHIGRQHIVLGSNASKRVTISYCDIDGRSDYSATCNNKHYWALYFTGSSDLVTLRDNYIHSTSGRSPKVGGNTLLHATNNYWYDNPGHAFEVGAGSRIVAEGNAFQNVVNPIDTQNQEGNAYIFTSPDVNTNNVCKTYLGRVCQINAFGSSGAFDSIGDPASSLENMQGKNVARTGPAQGTPDYVVKNAGVGKL